MKKIFLLLALMLCSGCSLITSDKSSPHQETNSVPAGWKTYTNSTYGYSFSYPPTWRIDDRLFQAFKKNVSTTAQPDDSIFLTNLTDDEITTEIKNLEENSHIDSGWGDVARGRMISIGATFITADQIHNDDFITWLPSNDIITTSGTTVSRFRQTSDYEIPTDAEHGFLPYTGTHAIDDIEIHSIDFSIERNNDTADIATFEAILKTVRSVK